VCGLSSRGRAGLAPAPCVCAPSRGIGYLVKVREGGGRTDLSEAQGHPREGVSGGSVEREERADEQEPDTEAEPSGASGHMTAKLQRPRGGGVDPAVVLRKPMFLPGEISPDA